MLKVNEIFLSIQGESSYAGFPCIFIRLTGCNLRCNYCDTTHAYKKGSRLSITEIHDLISQYQYKLVEITGGEPLLQEETPLLVQTLIDKGYKVLVETNGTQDINQLPIETLVIIDIKCPGSGESEKTLWENIHNLKISDEVKFVLSSQADYIWAKEIILQHNLIEKTKVFLSPVIERLPPAELAWWILEDHLNVRLQLQMHKFIWHDQQKGK
jgi:7-carboxy-7-deazaguanine synthase